MSGAATAYDEVIYPGNPIRETHPDRLAAIGAMLGMSPAPPSRCRVLELGCGIGGNLMSLAYQWPDSTFVGIDLSSRSIELGNGNVAELALSNVTLRHFDIMGVTEEFGEFDYIIAHGVYSWVPEVVRGRLLEVYKQHLAPQGIGYVSYNALPGAHLRGVVRDMMLFHVRGLEAPREKIEQAHAVLKFIGEAIPEADLHGRIVRDQLKRIEGMADEVLFHDDLEPSATPFLLHEVAEAAARHGLQYLADSNFASRSYDLPAAAAEFIAAIPESDAVAREQYLDFLVGRSFHRTLLCHDNVALDRRHSDDGVRRCFVAANLTPASEGDVLAPGAAEFNVAGGTSLQTDHPLAKAALLQLGAAWPESVSFPDLFDLAMWRVADAGVTLDDEAESNAAALSALLLRTFAAGQVELHSEQPPTLTTAISERPEASLLARKSAANGPVVTNLRSRRVALNDEAGRRFLMLVDGSRTLDELAEAFSAQTAPATVTRAQVEENLRMLARLALLVR